MPSRGAAPAGSGGQRMADGHRQEAADERHRRGEAGRPDIPDQGQDRCVGHPEGDLDPGEPAERGRGPQPLPHGPGGRDDDGVGQPAGRPSPWPGVVGGREQPAQGAGDPDVERLQHRQGDPGQVTDVDPGPVQRRQVGREAGHDAEEEAAAGARSVGGEGQQGDPHGSEPPHVVVRPGQPQGQTRADRERQGQEESTHGDTLAVRVGRSVRAATGSARAAEAQHDPQAVGAGADPTGCRGCAVVY